MILKKGCKFFSCILFDNYEGNFKKGEIYEHDI